MFNTVNNKELKNINCMGFNGPKVATIEPSGTIGCIQYIIDIFKELKLKIKKSEKNPDPIYILYMCVYTDL